MLVFVSDLSQYPTDANACITLLLRLLAAQQYTKSLCKSSTSMDLYMAVPMSQTTFAKYLMSTAQAGFVLSL